MCGIAGYFGKRVLDQRTLDDTLRLMQRRGPDASGQTHFVNPAGNHVYLLHSRLAILDLDPRSNQPMSVDSKTAVYNGELYNFVELRRDLERRGHAFATRSDTEVLLRSLVDEGETALDRCEGMWAFAAYDERDGSLVLSRDRFGEKPLYVYRADGGLYFGSEIKLLRSMVGARIGVDLDQIRRFLVNGYKSLYKEEHGFFLGVREVPPGSFLKLDAHGREVCERYWRPSFEQDDQMPYGEAVRGTRERLIRSVELRLRADVPLAFCMSGGVDSNALISIAKRELGYDVHGFTVMNTDERFEESDLVESSVAALALKHTALGTDVTDFLAKLRTLVRYHDAPVYTISYYAHWLLMGRIADAGYRVSVSGTAADELFTGYYDHHLAYLAGVKGDAALHAPAVRGWTEHVKPLTRNPFLSDPDLFVHDAAFRDHIYLNADGFAAYLREPFSEPFREHDFTPDLLRNRMLNELFFEATPVILHEDDLNAMYFSIENRSPFLDRALFEHAMRIPSRHLMRDGYAKIVLRDAMRGIVPDAVLDTRRKVGFNAPIFAFLDIGDASVRAELLAPSPIWDVVRRDKVEALLDKAHLPNSESKFLFSLLSSKLFLEEHGR
jgi:asparagine synthase (glutamine-hydrolysing)